MEKQESGNVKSFLVTEYENNERLDRVVVNADIAWDIGLGRSYIQGLIINGDIKVNNKKVKSSFKVKTGDEITLVFEEVKNPEIKAEDLNLVIIYEDEDIAVINKPKNMVVHPSKDHLEGTLVNGLLYEFKDNLSTIGGWDRPGIVHRLDRDTTGLVVICKNNDAHENLSKQFISNSVKRSYQALIYNHMKTSEGQIEAPISRHPKFRTRMTVDEPQGRYALTNYKLIRNLKNSYAYIECSLFTGRTHQIRVHLASINHPIVGDKIYNNNKAFTNVNGQALHASLLGFNHPRSGECIEFNVKPTDEFYNLMEKLDQ